MWLNFYFVLRNVCLKISRHWCPRGINFFYFDDTTFKVTPAPVRHCSKPISPIILMEYAVEKYDTA